MKKRNQILALAMGFCLLESTQAFAAAPVSQEELAQALEKVTQQTVELQKEVKALKTELRDVKQQKSATTKKSKGNAKENADSTKAPPVAVLDTGAPLAVMTGNMAKPGDDLDPSGLISYQSSMNLDKTLLEKNQAADNLPAGDTSAANKSRLLIGGKLETQGTYVDGYGGSASGTTSSIDLTTAEIDTMARISDEALGFMAISYNNAPDHPVLNGSGNVINNSNIYLNRGFLTIGNLNKTPFYLTAGQMYVPFGNYSSWIVSNPLTKVLGRTNTRAIELGFDSQKTGFFASTYVFDGAANSNNSNGGTLNTWGANSGYNFKMGKYDGSVGLGFINDISSSQGMQQTGSGFNTFQGFSASSATESLKHYVPGVDINASISRGPFYLLGEGVGATRSYDSSDLQYNGAGADPKAVHFEAGYNFKWFDKKSIFSVAYDHSWQGLALGLPQDSYIAAFNMSIWKNTVESLEFRHDVNYPSSDTAGGPCIDTNDLPNTTTCVTPSAGGSQNSVIAQIGVYF